MLANAIRRCPRGAPLLFFYIIYISFPLSGGLYSKHKENLICLLDLEVTERNVEDHLRKSNHILIGESDDKQGTI